MQFDLSNPSRDIVQEFIDTFNQEVELYYYERFGD